MKGFILAFYCLSFVFNCRDNLKSSTFVDNDSINPVSKQLLPEISEEQP